MVRDRFGVEYVIRLERIEQARKLLGLAGTVEVSIRDLPVNDGHLDGERNGLWLISLDKFLGVTAASEVLWEELVHAWQAEREGGWKAVNERMDRERLDERLDGPNQRKYFRGRAIDRLPLEREAKKRARELHARLALAERRT